MKFLCEIADNIVSPCHLHLSTSRYAAFEWHTIIGNPLSGSPKLTQRLYDTTSG